MNRHQVLTGASNNHDYSVSIGSVENNNFIAYTSGCNIVILSSNFERVQIISGSKHSYSIVRCIDCTIDTGKIAASYDNYVAIYEPTPSAKKASHNLFYKWIHIGTINLDSTVIALSWNMETNRLLIGCNTIQMWSYTLHHREKNADVGKVQFTINDNEQESTDDSKNDVELKWKKIWEAKVANPLKFLQFSPDGALFASYGENDRLVKIWYEVRSPTSILNNDDNSHSQDPQYHYIYLSHPRAVTSLQWRGLSKFMPRGMIANTLITSCKDNVCRIWAETILPDDGLIHSNQEENSHAKISQTSRHKRTVLQKLHKMRLNSHFPHLPSFSHSKSLNNESLIKQTLAYSNVNLSSYSINSSSVDTSLNVPLSSVATTPNLSALSNNNNGSHSVASGNSNNNGNKLQSSNSCQEFYAKHNLHHSNSNSTMNLGFHFHLAGFINAENGIPLNPNMNQQLKGVNFIVNWMNNKDFTFTLEAELISRDLIEKLRKIQADNDAQEKAAATARLASQDDTSSLEDNESNSEGMKPSLTSANLKRSKFATDPKFNQTLNDSNMSSNNNTRTVHNDSMNYASISEETKSLLLSSSMDLKLDSMMKDWYTSHDMLFCIHPTDGSILIWIVDWLDEYIPNGYRQAQISFHARLPNAIPIGDAMSMKPQLFLFAASSLANKPTNKTNKQDESSSSNGSEQNDQQVAQFLNPQGIINMVSKHYNGTLNLWQLTFQESSKYQSLMNILHLSRICGHRFRVNDITCHPTLPLLLSNSHNDFTAASESAQIEWHHLNEKQEDRYGKQQLQETFQTGLIIWRVEPVGPLSKSGGIFELARVDSLTQNAFENIAWFPCFLPSSTLGNVSSSPSTLFASTDSECITIYQAVLDARTLLHEMQAYGMANTTTKFNTTKTNPCNTVVNTTDIPYNSFNVVSIQSTARPGCIIELDKIVDSQHNWKKAHLFHVFQEGLIVNDSSCIRNLHAHGSTTTKEPFTATNPASNVHNLANSFNENFFLVLLEKSTQNTNRPTIHMWKLSISSAPLNLDDLIDSSKKFEPDSKISQLVRNVDNSEIDLISLNSDTNSFIDASSAAAASLNKNRITIVSSKVCSQELDLPDNVHIIAADPAAADLASSCMFTLSKVSYLFATCCSDGVVRFWSCDKIENSTDCEKSQEYKFYEWNANPLEEPQPQSMVSSKSSDELSTTSTIVASSQTKLKGCPLAIACSYNGRFAVAYRLKNTRDRDDENDLFMNICVHIYECESTGGSSWKLEDSIHLQNIKLPEIDSGIDFDYIYGNEKPIHPSRSAHSFKHILFNSNDSQSPEIPSTVTKYSIRKQFTNKRQCSINTSISYLTRLVQLDWASMENGSHILTVGLGNKIFVYSCVSRDLDIEATSNGQDATKDRSTSFDFSKRRMSRRYSIHDSKLPSLAEDYDDSGELNNSLLKWIQFRHIELESADGMQALPVQMKWVRDGLLVIGLDTEMQVYSQWTPPSHSISAKLSESIFKKTATIEDNVDKWATSRKLSEATVSMITKNPSVLDFNMLAKSNLFKPSLSVNDSANQNKEMLRPRTKSNSRLVFDDNDTLDYILNSGLFIQAKREWPVLPQYHPTQLFELMNAGKINRVKAILMHLTRCIIDCEFNARKKNAEKKFKSHGNNDEVPEEQNPSLLEIKSIPPLPMFALYAADYDLFTEPDASDARGEQQVDENGDYEELFERKEKNGDDLDDDTFKIDDSDVDEGDESNENRQNSKQTAADVELKNRLLNDLCTNNANNFNSQVCNILIEYLMHVRLAGLESLDQMYLVALVDTVANVKCDVLFEKNEDLFLKKEHNLNARRGSITQPADASDSQIIDNCGLKYLLALRHYNYLMRTLPIVNRTKLVSIGIGTSNYAWAYHSECEQELLNAIPRMQNGTGLNWPELRQYGVGWWIKNSNVLRLLIEKLAKCAFQAKNDPLDAALYYLAMKKKGVLWGLFKTVKDSKMTEFFKNDFTEQRWQTAAMKNAYALLGKQRFEHAAAFFLLAGRLKDAVNICFHNLHDTQLAFIIIRLYETDIDQANAHIKQILLTDVLGYNSKTEKYEIKNASKDPFLRSIAYWYIKEYNLALSTLFDVDFMNKNLKEESNTATTSTAISDVFNFYAFLKNHPLVMREQSIKISKTRSNCNNVISIERRLHFQTAYYHIINGCPLLTLDVLSKLPKYIEPAASENENENKSSETITETEPKKVEKADAFDWSNPLSGTGTNRRFEEEKLELELKFSDDEDEEFDDSDEEKPEQKVEEVKSESQPQAPIDDANVDKVVDLFAQQLKFIACLKVLIEEMSTLATGFEVTGGQLRYYMYYWLERETNILKDLSDYQCAVCERNLNMDDIEDLSHNCTDTIGLLTNNDDHNDMHVEPDHLHEQVIKDQKSFHAKVQRLNKRKLWLRSNELLLRTLLSYCSLHSAHGGGLASVRMELILLMQELIEDRGMKQLLSPIPLPTTIPLLTAIVVSSKTVVAGPIRMINGLINDILSTITDLSTSIPTVFENAVTISTIKELSVSLSACIYQCLCDSDAFCVPKNTVVTGMQGFCRNLKYKSSYLMSGLRQSISSASDASVPRIDSSPKNWPGVSTLIKLLDREQDIEAPKLKILLLESLIAVYSALLINAFVFYDCSTLWRLLAQSWNGEMWGKLFGGGCKTEYKYKTSSISSKNMDDENAKHRLKMNARLGHLKSSLSMEDKVFVREHFIAPQISMINFFLTKANFVEFVSDTNINYESDDEIENDNNEDLETTFGKRFLEHMNPNSYSWCLMRYAIVKYVLVNITTFLNVIGVEIQELPILSPIIHATLKTYENWLTMLRATLNTFNGPPDDYIPGCAPTTTSFNGPKLLKYQSMLDPANTPFCNDHSANTAKRLWHFLVTRKSLYDIFIRYIFKKKQQVPGGAALNTQQSIDTTRRSDTANTTPLSDPNASTYKIIHKDQEAIHGFCLNERDKSMLSMCTSKEIIEMDIKNLLVKNITIDDECEMDILAMQNTRSIVDSEMLVIGNANDPYVNMSLNEQAKTTPNVKNLLSHPYSAYLITERTKYLLSKMLKRNIKEVRRLASHPILPYYLGGTSEGVVKLWHWGSNEPLSSYKQGDKSLSAKITKLQFNTHGNKFGVGDAEGYLHLYQLLGCSFKSYMTLRCHKTLNDFLFVDSSSLLFTVGIYNDAYEVSLWDTLMPPSKALTMCFREPDVPSATCVAYSPISHFAYVGNRKGELKIYDLRMHKIIQKIIAHESSVKAITIDKDEYYMATGSSEGNMKIWNLKNMNLLQTYHGDHSKSSLIRNFNAGVNQLHFTNDNQLISCGTDGAILIRNFNNTPTIDNNNIFSTIT